MSSEWPTRTLGSVVALAQNGCGIRAASRGTPTAVLRLADVDLDGSIAASEHLRCVPLTEAERNKYLLRPGDLLVWRVNGSKQITGRSVVFAGDGEHAFCDHFIRLRLNDEVLSEFVAAQLNSGVAREAIEFGMVTTAGQNTVSQGTLLDVPIRVPALDEQRRIVAKLDALRARSRRAKDALDAVPALLDRLRQSILAAAFRGDLTAHWREQNPDVEPASELLKRIRIERRRRWDAGELPGGRRGKYSAGNSAERDPDLPQSWAAATWGEIGFSQNGRAYPSSEYSERGVKLLRPGNLHVDGSLEWTAANTKYMPESWAAEYPSHVVGPDEIVMNLTAQSLKDEFLGRVCLTAAGERCLLNQRIARLTPIAVSQQFVLWMFKAPQFRRFVDELNTGSLIQHMFTSQLDEFAFPLPPAAEQVAIVAQIERLMMRLRAARAVMLDGVAVLNHVDSAILAAAFRGELVPRESDDAPDALATGS